MELASRGLVAGHHGRGHRSAFRPLGCGLDIKLRGNGWQAGHDDLGAHQSVPHTKQLVAVSGSGDAGELLESRGPLAADQI